MYKYQEIFPFNLLDLDNIDLLIPKFKTTKNKKSIVYFNNKPTEIVSKNKILIVPFCDCGLFTQDIESIEQEMLSFARTHKIMACNDNCIHITKMVDDYKYHGFSIL